MMSYVDDLVSIMIPCYNGADFLPRLVETLIYQTYAKVEIVFINDGSTDSTKTVWMNLKDGLEEKGYLVQYVEQDNQGLAAAINTALSLISGEFCMWFDVDDFMTSNHIMKKVEFLKNHTNCDLVMCKGYVVAENDTAHILGELGHEEAVSGLFEDILFERRRCSNGLFMVRTNALLRLTEKKIYPSRAGQNMQLLLPVAFTERVGYIDDYLFFYVYREDSHSHIIKGADSWRRRLDDVEKIKLNVLKNLELEPNRRLALERGIALFYLLQRLNRLDRKEDNNDATYVDALLQLLLENLDLNGRKLYLWGACENSAFICRLLRKRNSEYMDIGYIDSDKNKIGKIFDGKIVEEIAMLQKEDAYIVILLEYHEDIINKLKMQGFKNKQDFFYPKFELREI